MNGEFITLTKGNEKRVFFLFLNGQAREVTKGIGKLMSINSFYNTYYNFINTGWTEE